jgi:hypothetical protein
VAQRPRWPTEEKQARRSPNRKPPGCEPGGVSSQGRGGDARGIKPSELGGVLQDAHYREQDYADGENGHGHNAKCEQGPHGPIPSVAPRMSISINENRPAVNQSRLPRGEGIIMGGTTRLPEL